MMAPSYKFFEWSVVQFASLAVLLMAIPSRGAAEEFTAAIRAYLEHRVQTEKICGGIVIGIVDEYGSRIVSYGKLADDSDRQVDGDTLFEIGSVGHQQKTMSTTTLGEQT
jgi:CubicO group peptidase (beta-lactamase class C family)